MAALIAAAALGIGAMRRVALRREAATAALRPARLKEESKEATATQQDPEEEASGKKQARSVSRRGAKSSERAAGKATGKKKKRYAKVDVEAAADVEERDEEAANEEQPEEAANEEQPEEAANKKQPERRSQELTRAAQKCASVARAAPPPPPMDFD